MRKKPKFFKKLSRLLIGQDNGLPYLAKEEGMGISSQANSPALQTKAMFHQTCQTLKYSTFIKLVCGKSIALLTISGLPEPQALADAWEAILTEYSTLIETGKSKNIFELYKRIVRTQWLFTFLSEATNHLKKEYDQTIAQTIFELGYDYIQEDDNREEYLKQIYLVESEAKSLVIVLNQLNNEYKLLCPVASQEIERTEMDYYKELAILGKFQGGRINADDITVFEFAAIVNSYLDYIKANEKNG